MVPSGLTPGRHNIVTYHNSVWERELSSCVIDVDGTIKVKRVQHLAFPGAEGYGRFAIGRAERTRFFIRPGVYAGLWFTEVNAGLHEKNACLRHSR